MLIDLNFTYKNIIRLILINKFGKKLNTLNVPKIKKIIYFFYFKRLEDLDDVQIFNSFYLFKFFLGRNAFFSKNKSFYFLGKWYYNFNVQLIINNEQDINNLLFFFLNNILVKIDKSLIKKKFLSKNLNIFYFLIKDVNIFSEIKTNLGLFNLKQSLNFTIYVLGVNKKETKIVKLLLNNLKLNNFK